MNSNQVNINQAIEDLLGILRMTGGALQEIRAALEEARATADQLVEAVATPEAAALAATVRTALAMAAAALLEAEVELQEITTKATATIRGTTTTAIPGVDTATTAPETTARETDDD